MIKISKKFNRNKSVFQFKIILDNIKPAIWRRIQVPETFTFWDFHVAIQDAMGWYDCHLHDFEIGKRRTPSEKHFGIPNPDGDDFTEILPDWEYYIKDHFFLDRNKTAKYWYDFGDDWWHTIGLEKVLTADASLKYPICVDGKRACPPKDCGGVPGYYRLLKVMSNPKHKEYRDMFEWLGGEYDSEYFVPSEVEFSNSKNRLRKLLKYMN